LIRASSEENPDLFYAIPWSHGTLGFLVSSEIRIIPAKNYVKITYQPVFSRAELIQSFETHSRTNQFDFVEALVFSDNQAVVMTGNMTDYCEPKKLNSIGKFYKPWFYKHVEGFLQGNNGDEYIPLRDYYHRHTKSFFWEMENIIPFGNNVWYRYLLGWMLPPKVSLLKLAQTQSLKELYDRHHVVQDMLVPLPVLTDALNIFKEQFDIYPLWVCPMRIPKIENYRGFINPLPDEEMFVDIGAYGIPRTKDFNARDSTRRVEKFVRDVKGYQALYADTYMSLDEFREMFDHSLYDELRKEYKCNEVLPEIYNKVSKEARM